VENLVMFDGAYSGTRVLVTGNTGFKGAWICLWLKQLGARIKGLSLPPVTNPNLYNILESLDYNVPTSYCDIRNFTEVLDVLEDFEPEIVFHLAAQPLVRRSYHEPLETLNTNIMGTANVLEACRHLKSIRAVVNITSDKCYENQEWFWGYRESDPMGGHDPYSASKGCAELVIHSYRRSFFNPKNYGHEHNTLIASARAGNVIGGGDWGDDRLIPDIVRSIQHQGKVSIRNPGAFRPWQHVLEPLSGYLLLGQRLLEGYTDCSRSWNFGPGNEDMISVEEIVKRFKSRWNVFSYELGLEPNQPHEAGLLKLDCSLARQKLGWKPVWSVDTALDKTVDWYRSYYEENNVLCARHLEDYMAEIW
jgi:CDP-glucose 4,6-dehydratase